MDLIKDLEKLCKEYDGTFRFEIGGTGECFIPKDVLGMKYREFATDFEKFLKNYFKEDWGLEVSKDEYSIDIKLSKSIEEKQASRVWYVNSELVINDADGIGIEVRKNYLRLKGLKGNKEGCYIQMQKVAGGDSTVMAVCKETILTNPTISSVDMSINGYTYVLRF